MARRYELTDEQWYRVAHLLPQKKPGSVGRPPADNRKMRGGMIWIARSGAPWRDMPERIGCMEHSL